MSQNKDKGGTLANVVSFPDPAETIDRSCEWLAKIDRDLNEGERQAFTAWIQASPENYRVFLHVAQQWDRMDSLSRLADLFPEFPESGSRSSKRQPPWKLVSAAAVALAILVTVIVAGPWAARVPQDLSQPLLSGLPPENLFQTSIGEQSSVTLPDGSVLTLNTNSLVRAEFTSGIRAVYLQKGEVFVQVAPDESRPFRVYAEDNFIEAVGTEFSVEITGDQLVELIVSEGKVLVSAMPPEYESSQTRAQASSGNENLAVEAGEQARLGGDSKTVETIDPEDIAVKLSWRGGNLVFRGERLADAISEIERYTQVEFVILDDELKSVRVAGLFKAGDVQGLLVTLRENFNISSEQIDDNKILLTAD